MEHDFHITLVGLPNAGKSVIFNLITGLNSEVSPYPLSTLKPVQAVIDWYDPRLSIIAEVIHPEQTFPLKFKINDIGGIIPEQRQTMNNFAEGLECMRNADVLCHVLRAFRDPNVTDIDPNIDMKGDLKIVLDELCAVDCELIENRLTKLDRMIAKGSKDPDVSFETSLLRDKVLVALKNKIPLSDETWDNRDIEIFDSLHLITHKPYFIVANYDESQISIFGTDDAWKEDFHLQKQNVIPLCSILEADILKLADEDKKEFLELYEGLVLTSQELIPQALDTANRITYFTFGHLGLKQWSVPTGTTAVGAAKRLHTDFANRFIAAEVMTVENLLEAKSVDQLKNKGKMRLEGKDYILRDGDILYFRFSK